MGLVLLSILYSSFKCNAQMPFFIFNLIESPRYLMANNFNVSNSNLGKWFWCNAREMNLSEYLLDEQLLYNKMNETMSEKNITDSELARLLFRPNKSLACDEPHLNAFSKTVNINCQKFQLKNKLINKWHLIMPNYCDKNSTNCPLILDKNSHSISCGILHLFNLLNDKIETISIMNYHQMFLKNDSSQFNKTLYILHPFKRLVKKFLSEYKQPNTTVVGGEEFEKWCQNLINQNQLESNFISISFQCEPCFIHYPIITDLSNDCDELSFTTRTYIKFLNQQTIIDLYKKFFLDFELFGYSIEELFN